MKLAIFASKIYTMKAEDDYYSCMTVDDDKIVDVNNNSKEDLDLEIFDQVFEYPDSVILPGFTDSHIHLLGYGKYLEQVHLIGCKSKKELIQRVKVKIAEISTSEWVLGRGWDHEKFIEKEYPNKFELDSISKKHPILLRRVCGHIAVVNSTALEICRINKNTQDPEGGIIERFGNGEPTGLLKENAINLVSSHLPKETIEKKINILLKAIKKLNSYGITSVQTNDGNVFDLYKSLGDRLTVRTYLSPFIEEINDLLDSRTQRGDEDSILRWGRMKILSDGSLGGETAAMKEPYIGQRNKGTLIYSFENLLKHIKKAHKRGWQLETHAIGDYAAELVINAYEEAGVTKNRPVLTHCQVLSKQLMKKMAKLGIIANIQPIFINSDLHWAEKKIGKKLMKYSYAWKSMLENGIHCAGGSDAPVEDPNPLLGIHAAVNRQDNDGFPVTGWYMDQSLSIFEAVKLFTINSAYAEFQEQIKGTLEKGKLADFIVLDQDIFNISREKIKNIKVSTTFLGGDQVFSLQSNVKRR